MPDPINKLFNLFVGSPLGEERKAVESAPNPDRTKQDSFTSANVGSSSKPFVFSKAINALTQYGKDDPTKKGYIDASTKKQLLENLKPLLKTPGLTLSKESLSDLIKLLKHEDEELSSFAEDILYYRINSFKLENNSVSVLIEALLETQPEERKEKDRYTKGENFKITLLRAIGKTKDKSALPILLETLLNDDKYCFSSAAGEALIEIGDPSIGPALISIMRRKNSNLSEQKYRAITTLGEMKYQDAVLDLINALSDENGLIRDEAASALGKIGDKRAVEDLMTALVKGNWRAAFALGKIKDTSVVPKLIQVYEDSKSSRENKSRALIALIKIGDERVIRLLTDNMEKENYKWIIDNHDVVKDLKAIDSKILLPLLVKIVELDFNDYVSKNRLDDYDKYRLKNSKREALETVIGFKDKSTIPVLVKWLSESKSEELDKTRIIRALGKFEDKTIVPDLLKVYKNDKSEDVRREIRYSLVDFKDEAGVIPLFLDVLSAANKTGDSDGSIWEIIDVLVAQATDNKSIKQELKKIMNKSKNDFVKERIALNFVIEFKDMDAIKCLLYSTKNKFTINVAADALILIATPEALGILLQAIEDNKVVDKEKYLDLIKKHTKDA